MRLDINLASQPYEDARQFWMRWGTAVGAAGLLTLILLTLTVTGWVNARRDREAMAEKRAMIADRDRIRADAEEFLARAENRTTRDKSQFLNELIERKAFSWTRVLENLEKVMPPRVHLVSINPELDDQNQLALKMTVAGESRDRAIELARRMEESRRFAQTLIVSESPMQAANGSSDTERIEILAIYIPEPLVPPAVAAAAAAKNDSKPGDAQPNVVAKPKTKGAKGKQGLMPDLQQTRKNLKTALAVMAGVDLLALVVYFSPLVGSAETRRQTLNELQNELNLKTHLVAPLQNLPHKVVLAGTQTQAFYRTRFPAQDSQIVTQFGKLAAANGVIIDQAKYPVKGDVETGGLQKVEMEAELSGNYRSLAKFINALERDEMFFIIDSVALGGQPQGTIKLGVKLETYLKVGT